VFDADINDDDTVALREISNHIHLDDRVEHGRLPLFADGVTLVRNTKYFVVVGDKLYLVPFLRDLFVPLM
jgi:hypothetical protein